MLPLVLAAEASETTFRAARMLMAFSLGSHIVLSCLGIGLPVVIFLLHRRGLGIRGLRGRQGDPDPDSLELAHRIAKCAAVLFAVGAVSGTMLSFEMGILWPGLMGTFGDVIGLPFALEGVFFFLEAVFLGIYLYGWRGLPARLHLMTLVPVALSGVFGTLCIVSVNAWMNNPSGFDLQEYLATGKVTDVDPWAAMFGPNTAVQFFHLLPATYLVTGCLVAAVYASGMLKGRRDRLHRLGLVVGLGVAFAALPVQLISGDTIARSSATSQPAKFAASELVTETSTNVPMVIGGVLVDGKIVGAVQVPDMLSIILGFSPSTEVTGLDAFPPEDLPPVNVVHLSFDLMVGSATALVGLALWTGFCQWRKKRLPQSKWWLRAVVLAGPLAVLALEAGWTTTEVGRQPWIVQGVMRTEEAVTTQPGIPLALSAVVAVYVGMAVSLFVVLRHMSARWRAGLEVSAPYGPGEAEELDLAHVGADLPAPADTDAAGETD